MGAAGDLRESRATRTEEPRRRAGGAGEPREFLAYTFYKVRPEWRTLPRDVRAAHRTEFAALLQALAAEASVRTYSLGGVRGDVDFMTWAIADRIEAFVSMAQRVASTELGRRLDVPYAYVGMRRRSVYLGGHEHAGQEGSETSRQPVGSKYLFVYPFTKKREWYALPFEERQRMMRDHFRVGHKYPGVTIHTGYSFGLGDQEFVLAFESDSAPEFSDLVLDLRTSEASRYTAVETPIFPCIAMGPDELMAGLGD